MSKDFYHLDTALNLFQMLMSAWRRINAHPMLTVLIDQVTMNAGVRMDTEEMVSSARM